MRTCDMCDMCDMCNLKQAYMKEGNMKQGAHQT